MLLLLLLLLLLWLLLMLLWMLLLLHCHSSHLGLSLRAVVHLSQSQGSQFRLDILNGRQEKDENGGLGQSGQLGLEWKRDGCGGRRRANLELLKTLLVEHLALASDGLG